jgi:predicted ArsR family transcriptional regulator
MYRRSSRQLSVSLPERRYDLAGHVLASAIDRAMRDGVPVAEAVREAAEAEGRSIASAFVDDARSQEGAAESKAAVDREGSLERTADVLALHGYEPRTSEREICLANCPFDRLATAHTELVCSMNLALIDGVMAGLGVTELSARLDPQPGFCCVKVTGRTASS